MACLIAIALCGTAFGAEADVGASLEAAFRNPPAAARPWVFWYWVNAAASREGITGDLEAMRDAGLAGAYLMPIKGPATPPLMEPPVVQLSPAWWELVRHAAREADRVGLKLAMHVGDGFATAGGPWITPELSMQKVVWSTTRVDVAEDAERVDLVLPQPETNEGFYRDIAVLAYPTPAGAGASSSSVPVGVTTSEAGFDGAFLAGGAAKPQAAGQRWRSDGPGWFEYEFDAPFVARSLTVWPDGANYEALRLRVEASDDGVAYREVAQLEAPRHGWQQDAAPWTYALPATTARRFRFVFEVRGSEPGAEDLDSAKWRPVLKIRGLELSSEARIHQFEGKSGAVWRVAARTADEQVPKALCVPRDAVVDVTASMTAEGTLKWDAAPGEWTIVRMGHTSTGKQNETAGGGRGLECDKLSAAAARVQFDHWFGEIVRQIGPELSGRVLKVLHVDSWECGAQNWTANFADEFRQRRGYELLTWLPAMAGVPLDSVEDSERFLHDVRQTIAELMVEEFYGALAERAFAHGYEFSAECTAPTFPADGMAHFAHVDVPMGEFWLRSPTHDKPNDMLDAISAAHIYGKPIVQAEAFTELRMAWDEHPGLLKRLGDRQFALGVNRLVPHVWVHNPWLDRRPGATLDGIGTFFQRDQVWMPMARAWTDYLARCQSLLQWGTPVIDVAVFTGEELPRRAVPPWLLVDVLPGVMGEVAVARQRQRIANEGQPQRELPPGVTASANIPSHSEWVDPLRGYAYDSINNEALTWLTSVRDGRIELPGGASYGVLVVPGRTALDPAGEPLSPQLTAKLQELAAAGAAIVLPPGATGVTGERAVHGPIVGDEFLPLGLEPDCFAHGYDAVPVDYIAWTHRGAEGVDVYFLSNQLNSERRILASLRAAGRVPEIWDPVTGAMRVATNWERHGNHTSLPLTFPPNGSVFVVFRRPTDATVGERSSPPRTNVPVAINGPWRVSFATAAKPQADVAPRVVDAAELFDWATSDDDEVQHFAGIATYETKFLWNAPANGARRWLDLGRVANLAEVALNGQPCGVLWTPPYRVDVTNALKAGENELRIAVANTWHNRLVGDARLPPEVRGTWTTAPALSRDAKLLEGGLLGPVRLVAE